MYYNAKHEDRRTTGAACLPIIINNNPSSSVKFNFGRRKIITTREQAHHQERQNQRRTLLNCLPAASLSIHYSIDWPNKGNEDCHTSPKINGNINGAVKMPRSPFVALIRKCFMIYGHCNNQRHTTTTITYLLPATVQGTIAPPPSSCERPFEVGFYALCVATLLLSPSVLLN